jgi:nucleoside-diphosphate-sugar epimerase
VSEVLVTGGNGFVGRHLVRALLHRGSSVRVLALPDEDTRWLERHGVWVYRGDVRLRDTLAAPMQGVDAVFHLAAMMDVWRPLADYRAVNVSGTVNVCRAALASGVRRLVHMSSSSVYGPAGGAAVDETAPLEPFPDPYPVTKAEGELAVAGLVANEGLPAVILRPDQIFGPGDRMHFGRIAARLRAGRGVIVGSGENRVPLVYVADAVQALLLAQQHKHAVGQAYNVSAARPLTQRAFLEAIARALGVAPPRVRIPYRALYLAGWLGERAARLTPGSHRPPITRLGVSFIGSDCFFAIDKATRELGYKPAVELDRGVRLTAAWCLTGARWAPGPLPARHAQEARA